MDNFRASYLAGALMINRNQVKEELKEIFQSKTWNGDAILELLKHHEVTPETFLHRPQPKSFRDFSKSQNCIIFVLNILLEKNEIILTKELNMPRILVPSGVRLKEHHCRRWLPVSLLKILEEEQLKGNPNKILIRTPKGSVCGKRRRGSFYFHCT